MQRFIFITMILLSSFTQVHAQPKGSAQSSPSSKYTGLWVGQGQDYIEINFKDGIYNITLDADNASNTHKSIIKAKEVNGKLSVDPGIYYGYNGMSTMTLTGKKLVLKSGVHTYTYTKER